MQNLLRYLKLRGKRGEYTRDLHYRNSPCGNSEHESEPLDNVYLPI